MQAGADLHAKTKNGETPLEICEDPELKERIIQLKSEMETKKASHTSKLKRSHSSNTRSQSVRRTSIREKTQISRREAREEARMRQEKQDGGQTNGGGDEDEETKVQLDINEFDKEKPSPSQSTLNVPVELENVEIVLENNRTNSSLSRTTETNPMPNTQPIVTTPTNSTRCDHKEAVVIKNTGFCEGDTTASNHSNGQVKSASQGSPTEPTSPTVNSLPRGSSGESVKVEIHVTVNTTPTYGTGTLADLKKQRADMRHRGSGRVSPSDSPPTTHEPSSMQQYQNNTNSHMIKATYMLDSATPPSPSNTLKKFRGDPSEVVGEIHKKGCCVIS